MVRVLLSLVLALSFAGPAAAEQDRKLLTGDDLKNMLRQSEQAHRQREQELKTDQMHRLYRVKSRLQESRTDSSDTAVPEQQQSGQGTDSSAGVDSQNPHGVVGPQDAGLDGGAHVAPGGAEGKDMGPAGDNGNPAGPATSGKASGRKDRKQGRAGRSGGGTHKSPLGGQDRYIPPSWKVLQGGGGFVTDQAKQRGPEFGIRMGTRIHGEIRRVVTNVERNLCEVYLTQDVVGDRRTMAAGTVLFCSKSLNQGTKRLEISAVKGITPDGVEFTLQAYAMDTSEMAGLSGAITTDEKTVQRSIGRGAYEIGREMVSTLNDGSLIGVGVEAAAGNALDESETETDKSLGRPQYIITVPPQKVVLRIEKTF